MNEITPLTIEQLAAITPSNVERVYSGKQGCMCGCLGEYYSSGRMVTKVLNILKADPRVRLQDGYILHIAHDLMRKGNYCNGHDRAERNYVVYLKQNVG